MSVIHRALKAAQREKSRLDAESGRQFAPVLVRVRTPQRDTTRRSRLLGGGGVAVALAAGLLWYRASAVDPLPDIPPVTSTMLSQALAADSGSAGMAPSGRAAASAEPSRPAHMTVAGDATPAMSVAAPTPAPRARDAAPPAATTPPPRASHAAALSAAPAASATERPATVADPSPQPRQAGALRIAVEPLRSGDAGRLFNEAIAAHRAGDLPRARALYERLLVTTPDDADVLNNLAVLLSGERDLGRALTLLRRAVAIAPRNAGAWNNMGAVLREQGQPDEAIAAYRQALVVDARHLGARVGLAQQYVALNALPQARQLLEEALAMNPRLAEAHYILGQVFERLGDRQGAIAAYGSFIRLAPSHLSRHVELVRQRLDALGGGA